MNKFNIFHVKRMDSCPQRTLKAYYCKTDLKFAPQASNLNKKLDTLKERCYEF